MAAIETLKRQYSQPMLWPFGKRKKAEDFLKAVNSGNITYDEFIEIYNTNGAIKDIITEKNLVAVTYNTQNNDRKIAFVDPNNPDLSFLDNAKINWYNFNIKSHTHGTGAYESSLQCLKYGPDIDILNVNIPNGFVASDTGAKERAEKQANVFNAILNKYKHLPKKINLSGDSLGINHMCHLTNNIDIDTIGKNDQISFNINGVPGMQPFTVSAETSANTFYEAITKEKNGKSLIYHISKINFAPLAYSVIHPIGKTEKFINTFVDKLQQDIEKNDKDISKKLKYANMLNGIDLSSIRSRTEDFYYKTKDKLNKIVTNVKRQELLQNEKKQKENQNMTIQNKTVNNLPIQKQNIHKQNKTMNVKQANNIPVYTANYKANNLQNLQTNANKVPINIISFRKPTINIVKLKINKTQIPLRHTMSLKKNIYHNRVKKNNILFNNLSSLFFNTCLKPINNYNNRLLNMQNIYNQRNRNMQNNIFIGFNKSNPNITFYKRNTSHGLAL